MAAIQDLLTAGGSAGASSLGGAGKGASAGMALGPLGAVAGGLLGGAIGLFTAKRRAKQARIQEGENQRENVQNQAWSGLLGQKQKLAQNIEAPSVLGGALQGGMAGVGQGMNVYQGMKKQDMNAEILKRLRSGGSPEELAKLQAMSG